MPARTASLGEAMRTFFPPTRISPPVSGSAPQIRRATSVRPAPISPARPRISPRRSVKLTFFTAGECRLFTSSTTGASCGTAEWVLGCS